MRYPRGVGLPPLEPLGHFQCANLTADDTRFRNRKAQMRSNVVTLAAATIVTGASAVYAASETITKNAIDANGVGKEIGTLVLSDTQTGLQITPQLVDLPPGERGFHAHVNPNCGPGPGLNGQPAAGMAAGGHYDPANTGKHLGPHGEGPQGRHACADRRLRQCHAGRGSAAPHCGRR